VIDLQRVQLNGELLWDRANKGGFPETKELKQLIRDRISPSRDLGHSEKKEVEIANMNDDEAEDMRKFFGVM
jgi:predicted Rdx family selenoprotein